MKIIIPTDFSDNAHSAALYGLHLADMYEASVTILHVYDIPEVPNAGLSSTMEDFINTVKKEAEQNLDDYMNKINQVVSVNSYEKINVTPVIMGGNVSKQLSKLVKQENMDLVVMGTQGRTATEAFFLGNVTSETLENVQIPVLTVPPHMNEKNPIDRVVFATDYSDISYTAMNWLSQFTDLGHLKISTLHIGDHDASEEARWKEIFSDKIENHIVMESKDFMKGLKEYAENHATDMVAMTITKKNFLYKLFNKPRIEKATYQKKIPVIGIPQEFLENL